MRIAVALSGGVDSLCALYLLRKGGHQVLAIHGLFLAQDAKDASGKIQPPYLDRLAALCQQLGVQFEVVDLRQKFHDAVISPFAQAYAAGQTPNPCAQCNRELKFGILLAHARELGAEKIATGHYARLAANPYQPGSWPLLAQARDNPKDQSYFLSLLPHARLAELVFPLAKKNKGQCRQLVAMAGLEIPLAKESQDLCFIPHSSSHNRSAQADFLLNQWRSHGRPIPESGLCALCTDPREMEDADAQPARIIGRHQGLWRYTEGQRKGLNIPYSEPLYVLKKDSQRNILWLGTATLLAMRGCTANAVNLFVPEALWPRRILARLRQRSGLHPARARLANGQLQIDFDSSVFPTAPGQVAALYDCQGRILAAGLVSELNWGRK